MRVLFIGRLGSYKRLDWLLISLAKVNRAWSLDVVGDGPRRSDFEALSDRLIASRPMQRCDFMAACLRPTN